MNLEQLLRAAWQAATVSTETWEWVEDGSATHSSPSAAAPSPNSRHLLQVSPPGPPPFDPRRLRLSPTVYLVSFCLLVGLMLLLLGCHCVRMVRLAQRVRRGEIQLSPDGRPLPAAMMKRTPRNVVQALPVHKYVPAARRAPPPPRHGSRSGSDLEAPAPAPAPAPAARALVPPVNVAYPPGTDVAGDEAETCAICFEEFGADDDVKQLPCSHIYHPNCIDEWLCRDVTCPLCKQAVADERALVGLDDSQPQNPFHSTRAFWHFMLHQGLAPLHHQNGYRSPTQRQLLQQQEMRAAQLAAEQQQQVPMEARPFLNEPAVRGGPRADSHGDATITVHADAGAQAAPQAAAAAGSASRLESAGAGGAAWGDAPAAAAEHRAAGCAA